MNAFWGIVASNAAVAAILAAVAVLLGRVWRNPAAIHLIWVAALLKLFTPPVVTADLPIGPVVSMRIGPGPEAKAPGPIATREGASTTGALAAGPGAAVRSGDRAAPSGDRTATAAGGRPWSLPPILAAIWAVGSCATAAVHARGIRRFARGLREFEAAPPVIRAKVARLSALLGLRRAPEVLMTAWALPPLVWSLGRSPRVILPSALFATLSDEAQETILAHELIHIRRRDHLVRLLEVAATTAFWWHPVAWLAGRRLRGLEERCCDGRVLELLPDRPRTYALALLETLEFLSGRAQPAAPLRTAIDPTQSLARRIQMLGQHRPNRLGFMSAALVAGLLACPIAVAFAFEQKPAVPPEVRQPAGGPGAALRGRVTNKAGVALPGARVRVAVPAADMRLIDAKAARLLLEARADDNGDYRLEIPGIEKRTTISVDALMPGFQRLSGSLMAGGVAKEVVVEPGATAEARMELEPSRYVAGIVVDDQGHPVPGAEVFASFVFDRGVGGVEVTASGPDGAFELFNYSAEPGGFKGAAGKGVVTFSHPEHIGGTIPDIDAIEPGRRREVRVVLPKGRKVSGTVLDDAGKPVAGAMVEAVLTKGTVTVEGDTTHRKATMTDATGGYALSGLSGGPTTLTATALEIKQKIVLPIDLDGDKQGFEVRLQAIALPADLKTYDVLGLKLADETPALKAAYDLYFDRGAVILDPGPEPDLLKIGHLAEGYSFWLVGNSRVGSVREFVDRIIAETGGRDAPIHSVRVVYSFRTTEFVGTNTQSLKLTRDDLAGLKAISERFKADAVGR